MDKKLFICIKNVPKEMFSNLPDRSCEGYLYEMRSVGKLQTVHLFPIYPDNSIGDVWIDRELLDEYFKDMSKMVVFEMEDEPNECGFCTLCTQYPNEDDEFLDYCDIDGHCCDEEKNQCPLYRLAGSRNEEES